MGPVFDRGLSELSELRGDLEDVAAVLESLPDHVGELVAEAVERHLEEQRRETAALREEVEWLRRETERMKSWALDSSRELLRRDAREGLGE